MLIKTLAAAILAAATLLVAAPAAAASSPEPQETWASDCRDSADEFQAEWNAACAEGLGD